MIFQDMIILEVNTKMLPRPKKGLESEISRLLKGIRSSGHFLFSYPTRVKMYTWVEGRGVVGKHF
jgi:hypothetical protein